MTLQFVTAISSSPTVRLDLDAGNWTWLLAGSDVSPPGLRRAYAGTLLADGQQIPASAYDNRVVRLALQLHTTTADGGATEIQSLWRELNRASNILKWHPEDATKPVFFRTLRASADAVQELRGDGGNLRNITVEIPAEPFAYGLQETLLPNLLSNPDGESGVSPWTGQNATITQSSAQKRSGSFALLITPAGGGATPAAARSEEFPVTAGAPYTATGWMYSVAGWASGVSMAIDWLDSGGSLISTSGGTGVALSAATWTQFTTTATAPAGVVTAKVRARVAGTPAATDTVWADDMTFGGTTKVSNDPSAAAGCYLDLRGVLGDVDTPAVVSIEHGDVNGKGPTAFALRRRGTPQSTPALLQCEAMTAGTDTTIQANDAVMSGSGQNFMRCTFGTTTMTDRLTSAVHPSSASVDARGLYRAYLRYRRSSATGGISVELKQVSGTTTVTNTAVALATSTDRRWADLGLVQIPFGADPVYDGYGSEAAARGTVLVIRAERTGSGNLDFDCLMLLPADDRLALITWPSSSGPTSMVLDGPNDAVYPVGSSGEIYPREHVPRAGQLPMLTPNTEHRLFLLLNAAAAVNDDVTSSVDVSVRYWPRYLYVRPAST